MNRLRASLYYFYLIITVIPYAFISIMTAPLPLHWRYRITTGWPRLAIWGAKVICGLRWEIEGLENLPKGKAIILAKHQSAWETLFLTCHLPREVCYVYKRELHRIPFFGWGLALLRMIPIDRAKGKEAFEQVVQIGQKRIDEGRWPLLFPEGTRIAPGKMGRFKMGGALLSTRTNTPIIPIALNAGEFWPRNSFVKRPGVITVRIGELIYPDGLTAEALNDQVYFWIESQMKSMPTKRD
jgi:1-acyl-sn-glycerol-3-phosphate acyltransferase